MQSSTGQPGTARLAGYRIAWTVLVVSLVTIGLAALTWSTPRAVEPVEDRSLLTGVPCKPPCWNGITPGSAMSLQEVERIVRQTRGVGSVRVSGASAIEWRWARAIDEPAAEPCEIYVSDGVVSYISLSIVPQVTVKDLIDMYGIPEVVSHGPRGLPEQPYYWLGMYYPTHGYHFHARLETYWDPVLLPSSRVTSVSYFPSYASVEDMLRTSYPTARWAPWPGFGPLKRNAD
jgi:hypothetical protein